MPINFQITALPAKKFTFLLNLDKKALARYHARLITVDENPGYPCRVSLIEAKVGETILALPYMHHDVDSPYRASGPIFVRTNAQTLTPAINEVPEVVRHRSLSVRAYDSANIMIDAVVISGPALEITIEKMFLQEKVEYLHLHNANPGCYSCAVLRA